MHDFFTGHPVFVTSLWPETMALFSTSLRIAAQRVELGHVGCLARRRRTSKANDDPSYRRLNRRCLVRKS